MGTMERGITIAEGVVIEESRAAERRRLFWLGWAAAFWISGIASGLFALGISLLTACSVLKDSRGLGIVVSSTLIGCLGALLLAAHGMDRIAALKRDSER